MESPIYQWIVARWHNISGISLDQSGKLISILFWMACIWPSWWMLGLLNFTSPQRNFAGVLIYSSPLYLYWGRAFMIETTGLFFALGMVACVVAGYRVRDWRWLLAALAFGTMAALCKASTWAIAVGVAGLIVLFSDGLPKWRDWRWIAGSGIVAVLPFIPTKLWLDYGDSLKMLNPFVRELFVVSSPHQSQWNYGTLQQKLDPATWEHIWRHITDQLLVPFPVAGPFLMVFALVAGAISSPKRIPLILIFLAGFASGPVIFTNLYFEHSYYWCANGIWLLLAVGTALAGIWECRPGRIWPQAVALVLALTIAVSGFVAWSQRFLPILQSLPTREQFDEAWRKPVQKIVPPGRTILIVGNDWNPNSLYYAERKGIAFPTASWIPFPGPQLDESRAKLDPTEALGAVVINERLISTDNQSGVSAILEKLGMSREGIRTPFGILFPALDLKFGPLPTNEK
ncbi:MAG: glycosyltransferase family 39 protein [Verrucomicrobiae bacterium]